MTPVLAAPPTTWNASIDSESDLPIELLIREFEGDLFIVALNTDMDRRGGEVVLRLNALADGVEIEVTELLGSRRTLALREGTIRDTFGPLAVHVYRVPITSIPC